MKSLTTGYTKMGSLNNKKGNLFKTYNFPLLSSDILRKVGNACVENLILVAISWCTDLKIKKPGLSCP